MIKIVVGIIAVVLIIYVTGFILPKQRKAQRVAEFNAPAEQIWEIVTDIEAQANWRPSLKEVKIIKHNDNYCATIDQYLNELANKLGEKYRKS